MSRFPKKFFMILVMIDMYLILNEFCIQKQASFDHLLKENDLII